MNTSLRRFHPGSLRSCQSFVWAALGNFTTSAGSIACTNGANVGKMTDYSGNTRNYTNVVAGRFPIWRATGMNGHPGVEFDGINDRLLSPSFSLPQPCTIFVVATMLNINGYIVDSIAGNGRVCTGDNSSLLGYSGTAFVASGPFDIATPGGPFAGAYVFNTTATVVGANDVFGAPGDSGSDTATTGMILGDYGAAVGGAPLQGLIGAVAMYSRVLSTSELTLLYRWSQQAFSL